MTKNLVTNGDFENGLTGWGYSGEPPVVLKEDGISFIRIPAGTFLTQDISPLTIGGKYTFSIKAKASGGFDPNGVMSTRSYNDSTNHEIEPITGEFNVFSSIHSAKVDIKTQIFMLNQGVDQIDGVYLDITNIQFYEN
ncbi:carbohydrate binding domain-containing protein [Erwinia tracheiphila]|nr:carbohydrate binding domain-containing protein [Erwinia tracheiphila]KKF34672.1 hypothetical protein SY86_03195 [Erwinia tracheiphila]UIA85447.1 carbohydrate binding domain-containing protein [Erwinia tracheiphila]UIA86344.1 carbohydrate binding domain-containing protein [Erwinia tracheiphila]UIA93967.1 carbohydrate binding domain-containing protein [Erwinia tracheiphila]UIA94664.1 carbohydrate binding domain-containing protein [Erwinia tracheiphila]